MKADAEPSAPDTSGTVSSVTSTTEDSNAESESTGSGWTVVVASLTSSGAAEDVAQRFRDRMDGDEHPVRVHSAQNGWHRVGMGMFTSFEAARSMLRDMNGRLPDGAWLLRISAQDSERSSTETAARTPSNPSG